MYSSTNPRQRFNISLFWGAKADKSSETTVCPLSFSPNSLIDKSTGEGIIEGGKANNGGAIFIEPGSTVKVDGAPNSWTVLYKDNKIVIADGDISTQHMLRTTPEQKAQMIEWEQRLNGFDGNSFGLGDYNETSD